MGFGYGWGLGFSLGSTLGFGVRVRAQVIRVGVLGKDSGLGSGLGFSVWVRVLVTVSFDCRSSAQGLG